MRLPADARFASLALGLTAALAGCSLIPGRGDIVASASASDAPAFAASGPAGDYPVVLGDAFTVDGQLYAPADTLNYDAVGYAGVDAGAGVTVAHKTLPLPSYVEVTSLATGKTILARVERRGPMTGAHLVALSPDAAARLGGGEGTPIRVRRVNPSEAARAELRAGRAAPDPIETPKSLAEALRRKLPASGMVDLRAPVPPRPAMASAAPKPTVVTAQPSGIAAPVAIASAAPRRELPPVVAVAPAAAQGAPKSVAAYPLPPLAGAPVAPRPTVVARAASPVTPVAFTQPKPKPAVAATQLPIPTIRSAPASDDGFVVQAGTFSVKANAQKVADALGGYIAPAGKMYRVRTGPFTNRGQAEAALAKVRAAGYSDARVYTAG